MNDRTSLVKQGPEMTRPAMPAQAMVEVENQRAIAETQSAMVMARRFPRDTKAALDNILNSCTRPTLAKQALYTYSRGGADVTGPSIRLAEAIAQDWGNIQFGIRELEQRNGESTVEAFAWDIERNTRQTKVFQVPHIRTKNEYVEGRKTGKLIHTKLTDQRDIYELVANNGARRMRACILGIIPGDIVEAAVRQCEVTMKTSIEITPTLINEMCEAFEKHGVTREQISKRIQRHIEAITPAQVVGLQNILNSMKDGMSSSADWFEMGDAPITAKPAAERQAYPEEEFKKNFPAWEKAIKGGKQTAERVITQVETKGVLTDEMKSKIRAIGKPTSTVEVQDDKQQNP